MKRIPEPTSVAPGEPHISWVIMYGDRDNPDREFACQSDPRTECVIPASTSESQVLSDVHVYYHGVSRETKYVGSVRIDYFEGATRSPTWPTTITVKKSESIRSQSIRGLVSSTPGQYSITIDLTATTTETGGARPIRDSIQTVVR